MEDGQTMLERERTTRRDWINRAWGGGVEPVGYNESRHAHHSRSRLATDGRTQIQEMDLDFFEFEEGKGTTTTIRIAVSCLDMALSSSPLSTTELS
jgi:hypothetical protein